MTFDLYTRAIADTADYVARLNRRAEREKRIPRDPGLRAKVFERDQGICRKCRRFHRDWIHDHVIPLADDGPDTLENSQTLCPDCEKPKTSAEAKARAKVKRLREREEEMRARRAVGDDQA